MRLPKRWLPLVMALSAGAFILPGMAWSAETTPVEAVNEPGGVYGENHRWFPERETVSAGSAVTFRNPTDVPHGVEWSGPPATPSCEEGTGKVPVGTTPAASGTKWSGACTFSRPGFYTFYCTVHGTEMNGTIKVTGTASATTDEVTEATQTTATLNGTIKPEGNNTEYHFEYGTTSVAEHVTSTVTLGSVDFGSHQVSAALTALTPSTKYHAELVAVYGAGKTTVLGGERTFTTATPIAPTVATGPATALNETEATLEGSVDPEGEATEYFFEYGTNSSYGQATAVKSLPADNLKHAVTMRLTGLTPGTEYHFRLVATNARGTSKGADETLKTLLAPTVVTKPAASVTQTAATLNATVNPNNAEVSECKLEYGTTTSYGSSALCTPAPGSGGSPVAVSAPLSGLSPNTTYHFRVSATNAGGTSKGADETLKTLLAAPTVVTKPAASVTQTAATLNATVNPNNAEVTECKLEYGTTTSYGSSVSCTPAPGSGGSPVAVSAPLSGLSPNTTYHFRVSATNAGGTSKGADETLKTLPNAPTVLTEPASSLTQATATLNATVNPNGGEVSECKLEYGTTASYGSSASCTSAPGSGTSPVAVSASVSGLSANTSYHFRVVATNAGGTSKGADETLKTLPNAPTVLSEPASSVTQTSATLNAIVNANGGEVSVCKLEYGTTTSYGSSVSCTPAPGSGGSPVAVSAPLSGLSPNTTYHFRVSATNAGGTSKGADETLKTLPNAPTVATGGFKVTQESGVLTGAVNPNGGAVTDCYFEYGNTTVYGSSVPCSGLPGSGTQVVEVSALVGGLFANATYHFRIVATNAGGTSYGADSVFSTPANPTGGSLSSPAPAGGSFGGGSAGSVATGGLSSAQIEALVVGQLVPSGRAAKIRALLRSGGFALVFTASEAGLIVVDWYHVLPGAKLARKAHRPLLMAAGRLRFSTKGTARVQIKLTVAGANLLRHTEQIKVTAKATFTPQGRSLITATRAFLLKR